MADEQQRSGVVNPDQLYTLDAFKRCIDIKDATLRAARRNGLRVSRVHGRAFVLGSDWIDYVLGQNAAHESQDGSAC